MATLLFIGLIGAPLVAAALLPLLRRAEGRTVWQALAAVAGLATLCAAGLLFFIGETPAVALTWLPGMGPLTFSLERAGLQAALATAATAALVFAGPARATCGAGAGDWLGGMVMLISLAAANAAFLSAHFLARYVALEVVGLGIALAALIELGGLEGLRRGGWVYLLLRLGDAGLLAAILLLLARTGTLEIGPALAAAPALEARTLAWVTAGFVLAVGVKVGLWPFHSWICAGRGLSRPTYLWLYATVMPNLGLYLLYRIAPLAALPGPLNTMLLLVGVGAGAAALAVSMIWPVAGMAPVYVMAAQGGLALVAAAGGAGKALPWALLVFTPVRALLWVASEAQGRVRALATGLSGGVLALFWSWVLWSMRAELSLLALGAAGSIVVLTLAWTLRAALGQQERAASARLQRAWDDDPEAALVRFAQQLHGAVEVRFLEQSLENAAAGLLTVAIKLYRSVEHGGLEEALRGVVRVIQAGSRELRGLHVGRLRANLLWVALALMLMVALLVLP